MMEFLTAHHLLGLTIGLCAFLCIGIFHPLVIKGEYYFGVKVWWVFLLAGIGGGVAGARHLGTSCAGRGCLFVLLEHIGNFRTARAGAQGMVPAQPAPHLLLGPRSERKTVESAPLSSQMMPYRCFFFYKSAKNCTKFHLINEYLLILHLMKAASPHRREALPTAHDSIF